MDEAAILQNIVRHDAAYLNTCRKRDAEAVLILKCGAAAMLLVFAAILTFI